VLREVLRDFVLIFLQNADTKAFLLLQNGEHAGAMVDADEDERRVERDRSERTGRHAMNLARRAFRGDDRDAAGKLTERLAEFDGCERRRGHGREN